MPDNTSKPVRKVKKFLEKKTHFNHASGCSSVHVGIKPSKRPGLATVLCYDEQLQQETQENAGAATARKTEKTCVKNFFKFR